MPLGNLFKLEKLTVEIYKDRKRSQKVQKDVKVMFNPSSFSMKHTNDFQGCQGVQNGGATTAKFSQSGAEDLSLSLVIDGTGVTDFGLVTASAMGSGSVSEQIDDFLKACYLVNGDIHEPNYLRIKWGSGPLQGFDCRLKSVDIKYTAFARNGAPLRAELETLFVADKDPAKQAAETSLTSPDLTHTRVVRSGDTLPLLCKEIYGSAAYYFRVAQVNQLDDFRDLTPGQQILFPPLNT